MLPRNSDNFRNLDVQSAHMCRRTSILFSLFVLVAATAVFAQSSSPAKQTAPSSGTSSPQATKPPSQQAPDQSGAPAAGDSTQATLDPEVALQIAVRQAGNDGAALVHNLEEYLVHYPNTPRRAAIYRGLLDAEMQLQNPKAALDYAERLLAIQPDDTETMFLAASILEKMPDEASQLHAIDYDSRLIDRVRTANPESRPAQMSLEDWQAGRNRFAMNLYSMRGRIEWHLKKDDEAVKDFTQSFRLIPTAGVSLNMGEIAEEHKQAEEAIRQYATAFVLSGQERDDDVDRDSLRMKLGNLWRLTHDSDSGLGDQLISAYDKAQAENKPEPAEHNKGLKDASEFSLRRVDGSAAVKLADFRNKTVVLSFWASWSSYWRAYQPLLSDVRKKFEGRDDVVFLAVDTDADETIVGPLLQAHAVQGIVVFADGIDGLLQVNTVPTTIVLDRAGKVAYRARGFAPDGFVNILSDAIGKASGSPPK
jgi:tetratricopeptide (TPR) repeat protein